MRSPSAQEPPLPPDSDTKAKLARAKLPFEVSVLVAQHLTLVTDPEEIAFEVAHQRKENFHHLIRRYISQIQYGCRNSQCTTPTCLSCRRRLTRTPVRKYTALSARTLACFLAEQRNPEAALCRNELVQPVESSARSVAFSSMRRSKSPAPRRSSVETHLANGHAERRSANGQSLTPGTTRKTSQKGTTRSANPKSSPDFARRSSRRHSTSHYGSNQLQNDVEGFLPGVFVPGRPQTVPSVDSKAGHSVLSLETAADEPPKQPQSDSNSFTQILFDTLPFRLLELMPSFVPWSPHSSETQQEEEKVERRYICLWPFCTESYGSLLRLNKHCVDSSHGGEWSKLGYEKAAAQVHMGDTALDLKYVKANGNPRPIQKQQASMPHVQATSSESNLETRRGDPVDKMAQHSMARREDCADGLGKPPRNKPIDKDFGHIGKCNGSPISHEEWEETDFSERSGPNLVPGVPSLAVLSLEIMIELLPKNSWEPYRNSSRPGEQEFLRQSLFYNMKDPFRLTELFRDSDQATRFPCTARGIIPISGPVPRPSIGLSRLGIGNTWNTLDLMSSLRPFSEILENLSIAIHAIFIPAISSTSAHLLSPKYVRDTVPFTTTENCQGVGNDGSQLDDWEAARLCVIGLHALANYALVNNGAGNFALPRLFNQARANGRVMPIRDDGEDSLWHSGDISLADFFEHHHRDPFSVHIEHVLKFADNFDDPVALNLLEKIVGVIENRWTFWEISKSRKGNIELSNKSGRALSIMHMILQYMEDDAIQRRASSQSSGRGPDIFQTGLLSRLSLCWLRTLMMREWNGQPSLQRVGTVGTILQILAAMYEKRLCFELEPKDFWTPVFARSFDIFEMPVEWLSFRPDNKTVHILSYTFLFPPETVVTYFRAINYSRMTKSLERGLLMGDSFGKFVNYVGMPVESRQRLLHSQETPMAKAFLLEVRRDKLLTDAINQIWRCQKRELLKPLKVKMGRHEGEEGTDVGGVQQEFYRELFGQALSPAYGMFTVDEGNSMTWFQPGSLEPLYKFEALGILMSIAIYNAVTLPVTFPIAFYRKLLGLRVKKLDHISDGWPAVAKGLQDMLDFNDGDVGDVYMRTYDFSFEAFGKQVNIDMEKTNRDTPWPREPSRKGKEKIKTASFDVPASDETELDKATLNPGGLASGSEEASLVTNANREQYVKDYIFWLTDKSIRPQYDAFARGFYTCLDRTALSIFTAEALQAVVEGIQEIDIDGLQRVTEYEIYEPTDHVIVWFWEIVRSWDQGQVKRLLEFVRASDRLPVNGVQGLEFSVQHNGSNEDMLPSSMTCFGKLLLPEYKSKQKLEEKLGKAVEESRGFGNS